MRSAASSDGWARPPLWFWGIPALVALLRMLPVLSLGWAPPPEGHRFLGVSYLPADFLGYAAFIRQVPEHGSPFFHDPFTTEPHGARFVLLFHWGVGVAARLSGLSPLAALEWSRVPLLFGFFGTLWWFLRPILRDPRERVLACLLVAFASGIEGFLLPLAGALPEPMELRFREDTSPYYGWSLFASCFNPLWIAALTLALLALRPLLFSERSWRGLARAAALLFALFAVHPYTWIGVYAVTALAPLVELALRQRPDWWRHLVNAGVLALAAAACAGLSLWQLQDPVFRATSGGVFGSWSKSVLWYPVTLGLLGALAVAGARRLHVEQHPARFALFGWVAAAVALQSLPVLNGYKFIFLLPLPLCILAAPVARGFLARRTWLAAGALLLFGGAVLQTVEAVRSTRSVGSVPSDMIRVVETLSREPTGHALTSPGIGNVLPAFTPHRVWVGHWFLTPEFKERSLMFRRFVWSRRSGRELRRVVREQRIRYVVVPSERADHVARQLDGWQVERLPHGMLELLILR